MSFCPWLLSTFWGVQQAQQAIFEFGSLTQEVCCFALCTIRTSTVLPACGRLPAGTGTQPGTKVR
eukprot:scaffold5875_cov53-Attheya_sp.AAC.5